MNTDREKNIKNPHDSYTREIFLKLTKAVIASGITYLTLDTLKDYIRLYFNNNPPEEIKELLKATSTVLTENQLDTSFEPRGSFTEEGFNVARQSVFAFNFLNDSKLRGDATCWVCHNDGNSVYFATAGHTVRKTNPLEPIKDSTIKLWRPNIDNSIQQFPTTVFVSSKRDAAVIKVTDQELSYNVNPLNFIDGKDIKPNTEVLSIGFPDGFRNSNNRLLDKTLGEYSVVINNLSEGKIIKMDGLNYLGGSGSPVFEVINSKWYAVAILTGFEYFSPENSIISQNLYLKPLIEKFY